MASWSYSLSGIESSPETAVSITMSQYIPYLTKGEVELKDGIGTSAVSPPPPSKSVMKQSIVSYVRQVDGVLFFIVTLGHTIELHKITANHGLCGA